MSNRIGNEYSTTEANRWKTLYKKHKKKKELDYKNGYAFKKSAKSSSIFNIDLAKLKATQKSDIGSTHSYSTNMSNDFQTQTSAHATTDGVNKCVMALGLACIILIPLSIILLVVGVATPYWFNTGNGNMGLFQSCSSTTNKCESSTTFLATVSSSVVRQWEAVLALKIIGSSILTLTMIFLCLYFSHNQVTRMRICGGTVLCVFLLLGAATVVGGTALMTSIHLQLGQIYTLEWSFYVCAAGAGLALLSFIFFVIHIFMLATE